MANITPLYGTVTNLNVTNLNGLASTGSLYSDVVNNITGKYMDYEFEFNLVLASATIQVGETFEIRYSVSMDNSTWSTVDGSPIAKTIYFAVGVSSMTLNFRLSERLRFPPPYFKLWIYNRTNSALAGSGNSVRYTPINIQVG